MFNEDILKALEAVDKFYEYEDQENFYEWNGKKCYVYTNCELGFDNNSSVEDILLFADVIRRGSWDERLNKYVL